ncbi:MAG: gliding motility protein [Deltaproteobacteria bacterium]|nr:gliding motility protein [Deltaproteobacteria bacterium]
MAQVNPLTRELLVKLVYYGPGLGGKTTSLQHVHQSSPAETRGQLVSLATPVDRTLYFDFLPLRAPAAAGYIVRDYHVRLQLFTVPGQVYFNATRKLVLTGVDGIVFVADSQRERHDANLESLENLVDNLEEQGRALDEIPWVLQLNKRDLPTAMAVEELERSLNVYGRPAIETIATSGEGVMEALDTLVRLTLEDLEARGTFGEEGRVSAPPEFESEGRSLESQIGAASEAIWRASVAKSVDADMASEFESEAPTTPSTPVVPPSEAPRRARTTIETFPPTELVGGAPSWAPLFDTDDQALVRSIERAMADGSLAEAITRTEQLVDGLLSRVSTALGAATDPVLSLPLLGVGGARWLTYRRVVRRARSGGPLDQRDALEALAMAIELRLAGRFA